MRQIFNVFNKHLKINLNLKLLQRLQSQNDDVILVNKNFLNIIIYLKEIILHYQQYVNVTLAQVVIFPLTMTSH